MKHLPMLEVVEDLGGENEKHPCTFLDASLIIRQKGNQTKIKIKSLYLNIHKATEEPQDEEGPCPRNKDLKSKLLRVTFNLMLMFYIYTYTHTYTHTHKHTHIHTHTYTHTHTHTHTITYLKINKDGSVDKS